MIHKNIFFRSFVYTFIVFILSVFLGIEYTASDDLVMQWLLNGSMTNGQLNVYSVFNNIIYSGVIGYLYSFFPAVEWYPVILLSLVILSIFVISYSIQVYTKGAKQVAMLFLLTFSIWFLAKLQFTSVTAFVSLAAYILFITNQNRRLAFILLFIASLIRFEMFVMITLCMLPHVLFDEFKKQNVWFFGTLFLAIGISLGIQHYFYNINDDWKYYIQFNDLRGRLNDNPNFNETILTKVLTQEEILLYQNFVYPNSLNISQLKILWEYCKGSIWNNEVFIDALYNYRSLVLLSVLFIVGNLYSKKFFLAIFPLIFWGLICYITINHFAKPRVVYPTFFIYAVISIYHLHLKNKYIYWVVPAFMIYKNIHIGMYHHLSKSNDEVLEYIEQNKGTVFIPIPVSASRIFSLSPFEKRIPQNLLITGWTINMPILKQRNDIEYTQNIFTIKPRKGKHIEYVIHDDNLSRFESFFQKEKLKQIKEIDGVLFFKREEGF